MVAPYWIQGKTSMIRKVYLGIVANQLQGDDTSCLTLENTANETDPTLIKSKDCTQKQKVLCKLEIPNAKETSLPPKFPCISSNQAVARKTKREIESVMQHRQNEPISTRCKE